MVTEKDIIEEIKEIDGELKRNWVILKALKLLKREREIDIGKLRQEDRQHDRQQQKA